MRLDNYLVEQRISNVERKTEEASRRLYEIDTLRSDVARLERTIGDLSSICDGLRNELGGEKDRVDRLCVQVAAISGEAHA